MRTQLKVGLAGRPLDRLTLSMYYDGKHSAMEWMPLSLSFPACDRLHALQKTDGDAFKFFWSDDGYEVIWGDRHSTIYEFSRLGHNTVTSATSLYARLMYGLQPQINLRSVHDRWSNRIAGCSFVTEIMNGRSHAYLSLSERACGAILDGLMDSNG